jgi:hypothetical protein
MRWHSFWLWVKARFRLDLESVCQMSRGRGIANDYHDYPDSTVPEPWHFYTHTCKRCGKQFTI